MPEVALVEWLEAAATFGVTWYGQMGLIVADASEAIRKAAQGGRMVCADTRMPPQRLIELTAAAIFERISLYDKSGKVITGTPISDAKVTYLTSKEVGKLIPDGWMIECQLGRYSAMWGEELSFPGRAKMMDAINDIREFLSNSIVQAAMELAASVVEEKDIPAATQSLLWSSSDRP